MNRVSAGLLLAGLLSLVAACEGKTGIPPSSSCDLTINPGAQTAPPGGGSFRTAVTSACAWTAASDDAWIAVDTSRGSGVGTVTYAVRPNVDAFDRQGRVRIGELVLVVTQGAGDPTLAAPPSPTPAPAPTPTPIPSPTPRPTPTPTPVPAPPTPTPTPTPTPAPPTPTPAPSPGPTPTPSPTPGPTPTPAPTPTPSPTPAPAPCPESVSPSSVRVKATGETVTFSVSAAADCKWSVSTGTPWISIETGSGAGSTRGAFIVKTNDGSARSGSVNVGKLTISVTQDAAPVDTKCALTLSPTSASFPADGGSFVFKVSVATGCPWAVEKAPAWVALRLKSGTGPADFGFAVEKNIGLTRSDAIVVNGQSFTVTQLGLTR
jgi:outer membrane biosynthesis protein TonB